LIVSRPALFRIDRIVMQGRCKGSKAARGPQVGVPRGALSLLFAVLLAAASAGAADAQVIRGRIISSESRAPMTDATVEALDSLRRVIVVARSDSSGRFWLSFRDPGAFRIRIRRIGIEPTLSDPLQFEGRDTVDLDLLVDERATVLDEVEVVDAQGVPNRTNARRLQEARQKGWRVIPPERVEPARQRATNFDQMLRSLSLANVMIEPDCVRSLVSNGCLVIFVDDMYFGVRGMNMINPRDVEFIAVISRADAVATYGNRASNGVLMIYTSRYEDRTRRRP
jgi:hypothetical protein